MWVHARMLLSIFGSAILAFNVHPSAMHHLPAKAPRTIAVLLSDTPRDLNQQQLVARVKEMESEITALNFDVGSLTRKLEKKTVEMDAVRRDLMVEIGNKTIELESKEEELVRVKEYLAAVEELYESFKERGTLSLLTYGLRRDLGRVGRKIRSVGAALRPGMERSGA